MHGGLCHGAPPDEYQCQAKRRNGKRCKKWRLKTSKYCQFHGGRRRGSTHKHHSLPMFYSEVLNTSLKQLVEAACSQEPHEQVAIFEELALMRVTATEAVRLYSKAQEADDETRLNASLLMRDHLLEVVKVAESAARIVASGKDKISVHDINHVVNQIVRIAFKTLTDDDARKFERAIRAEVKVSGNEGTTITPDQVVTDMDSTIPTE